MPVPEINPTMSPAQHTSSHQPSQGEQIVSVETPDFCHRSPDSGDLQYKGRGFKKAVWPL